MSKEFQKIESEKNSATKELEENSNKKEEIENKIKEFNEQIDKMSYELRMKDSRQKFLIETEKDRRRRSFFCMPRENGEIRG